VSGATHFTELLKDVFAPLGQIRVRRMFGGAGIYCDGTFFALVFDDVLYLKAGEAERALFEREGMGPFTYQTKSGKAALVSYYRAPERLIDETDELLLWGRRAVAAARQGARSPRSPAGKRPPARSRRGLAHRK
jgi:DNA transformation protein